MARPFSPATAEQMVSAAEATSVLGEADATAVADFADVTINQAGNALALAEDIGLVAQAGAKYVPRSPLTKFLSTASQSQKAAVVRVVLESYDPFTLFRQRLTDTGNATTAAQQTRALLSLQAHREEIKDTLISLGTYTQALIDEGGGRYRPAAGPLEESLRAIANSCEHLAAAEARIRAQLMEHADSFDRDSVILPLARALLRAKDKDGRGAVVEAGNAIESFLVAHAAVTQTNIAGATGINSKLDKFSQAGKITKKLVAVGKYLGNVRNAADHGIDADIGQPWLITEATGLQFVFASCGFLHSVLALKSGTAKM